MYTVIGIYPDGREALLEYSTLDQALQKIRDLAEADEIDSEGPMFVRYALATPKSSAADPSHEPQPPHVPRPAEQKGAFRLRLAD